VVRNLLVEPPRVAVSTTIWNNSVAIATGLGTIIATGLAIAGLSARRRKVDGLAESAAGAD
jgi:hypothetical protein